MFKNYYIVIAIICSLALNSTLFAQSSVTGTYTLKNATNNFYLTQTTDAVGANVNVQQSNSSSSQEWNLSDGPAGTTYFECLRNGQYLNSGSDASGTSTDVYTFNAAWWSMMWFLESVNGDIYRIKNRWANLYLTREANNNVGIYALNNSQNQLWILESTGDCPVNYAVNYQVNAGQNISINASNAIFANEIITDGADLRLTAGNEVILNAGFDAQFGCDFLATIDNCNTSLPTSFLSNPNADANTNQLYDFLRTFKDDPDQCLILGQNIGWSYEMFTPTVEALQQQTGQWLGIIGGQMRYTSTEIDYPALVTLYSNWQAAGGICELGMLPDNPWTGGSIWDRSVTDISQLTTPGAPGYAAWRTQLDFYADVLSDMQDAGVTILFRPLMEMNGDWFWYGYVNGQNNQQDFINLYRDIYDYFTNVKQLNNLIWLYAPSMTFPGIQTVDFYYPGDDVIDITGLSVYENDLALPVAQYQSMLDIGKPFAFTEIGPNHNNMNGTHDYESFINIIRNNYPETIYAHAWHDWPDHLVAWISNQNTNQALNIPCVVSRDEIDY